MKGSTLWVSIVLIGAILLSIFGYISLNEENFSLMNSLAEKEACLQNIELEKNGLFQKLKGITQEGRLLLDARVSLKKELLTREGQVFTLNRLVNDLARLDEEITSQIVQLRQENLTYTKERGLLELKFADLVKENDCFRQRCDSITELKKAIWELKGH